MTTFMTRTGRCPICGHSSSHREIMSTNTFGGYRDLDTRPPEMMRSTIPYWVQRCPHCGYVSSDLSSYETTVTADWLKSDEYLSHDRIIPDDWPDDCLELMFYRFHKVALHDGNKEAAAMALLHGAWACDDIQAREPARLLRQKAVPLFEELLRHEPDNDNLVLMIIDIKRRAGLFDEAIEACHGTTVDGDFANRIVAFQTAKAEVRDDRSFNLGHVTGDIPVTDLAKERELEDALRDIKQRLKKRFSEDEGALEAWFDSAINDVDEQGITDDEEAMEVLKRRTDELETGDKDSVDGE